MDKENSINTTNNKYNLEERTTKFGEKIIKFLKKIPKNVITLPIISQITRAGTSVGANYYEANGASSRKDFRNKIYICKKEIQETKHWLRITVKAEPIIKRMQGFYGKKHKN